MPGAASLDEALLLCRQGKLPEARRKLERIVAGAPSHVEALHLLGMVHGRMGRHRDAVAALRKASALAPRSVDLALQLGDAAVEAGETDLALATYDRVATLAPADARSHYNKGVALLRARRDEAAAGSFEQALVLEPRLAQAYSALGSLKIDTGDAEGAAVLHRRALDIDARNPEFHNNLGVALDKLRRHVDALASFDRAVALEPRYVEAWSNRGIALHQLQRVAAALVSFDTALAIDEQDADAWSNRALVLHDMDRLDEAMLSHGNATRLHPGDAPSWVRTAATANALKRHGQALAALEQATAIDAAAPEALGALLHTRMLLCDWRDYEATIAALRHGDAAGSLLVHPFAILPTPLEPALQRRFAERYSAAMHPAGAVQASAPPSIDMLPIDMPASDMPSSEGDIGQPTVDGRLRIGYFSADFRDHPMMVLSAEHFELHDRSRVETVAFSFRLAPGDPMQARAVAAFDRFVDVSGIADADVAALARSLRIDIAIDLMGYTRHARPGVFAHRAAPVQASLLGFPATMGAPWMDYLIADAVVVPEPAHVHCRERVVTMPHSYMPNGAWRPLVQSVPVPVPAQSRVDAGLPANGFVFCCFNNSWKITPDVFDAWMNVLKRVAGSVLWLLQTDDTARDNLLREARQRGVDPGRIVFARRIGREQHLQRHALADLFLDTFHYGAHTTASDALRMVLPVLTRTGETFASRVATSSLAAVGLPDLAVASIDAYESLAVRLATEPALLAAIRERLATRLPTASLFDARRYTRDIERAFVVMHARHRAGLPPEAFTLLADTP